MAGDGTIVTVPGTPSKSPLGGNKLQKQQLGNTPVGNSAMLLPACCQLETGLRRSVDELLNLPTHFCAVLEVSADPVELVLQSEQDFCTFILSQLLRLF